jgi:UDP-galactopyranose mutase
MSDLSETVLCFSHLRWRFVHQRPHHLLSRCARANRVFYIEEPYYDAAAPELEVETVEEGVEVVVPHLPRSLSGAAAERAQSDLIDELLTRARVRRPVVWFYTPMALAVASHIEARATVYDCMDELSAFLGAPRELVERERKLLERADVVFTGGHSLYEHKRSLHRNIHPFPSSVDVHHFYEARSLFADPPDQAGLGQPRIGFFGVIDERMDLELVASVAESEPAWSFVMIGPTAKIDPATLPRRDNIHWLGPKSYKELPAYLAGWQVAMLPFARNDSTRFISPTKTPEYLAAGKAVVSTSIRDVVRPYGEQGLVWIADEPSDFAAAIREALVSDREARVAQADAFLADLSWDTTWEEMWAHVERAARARDRRSSEDVLPPWAVLASPRALAQEE